MKKLFSELPEIAGRLLTLRPLDMSDAAALARFKNDPDVYKRVPAFLFEQKYESAEEVIGKLYTECIKESLILGAFDEEGFCGLAEIYGYKPPLLKASVGGRLLPRCWGKGYATEMIGLLVGYLLNETDVEIVTASTMVENKAAAKVIKKNGFRRAMHGVPEDWGFGRPTAVDKWIRTGVGCRMEYRFRGQ